MKTTIYCVLDKKTKNYLTPFPADHDATAIKQIQQAMAKPETYFSQYPQDYELHYLAVFDTATGKFLLNKKKKLIGLSKLKRDIPEHGNFKAHHPEEQT